MLSENYFYFSNLSIFRYEIKKMCRSILRFAVEWTRTFTVINSSDVNCVLKGD